MGAIGVGELEGRSRDLPRTQSLRLPDLQDLDGVPGVEVVADIAEPEHCSALRISAQNGASAYHSASWSFSSAVIESDCMLMTT